MKNFLPILLLLWVFGCQQSNKKTTREESVEKSVATQIADSTDKIEEPEQPKDIRQNFDFDITLVPEHLRKFLLFQYPTGRTPTKEDYDDYYFTGYANPNDKSKLPFFCSGNFNGDSLTDYAVVLIEDSTYQTIYGLIALANSEFESFKISTRKLQLSEDGTFQTVVFNIETETEHRLEGIDTVYMIDNDGISINDMYNSRSHIEIWNERTNSFESLLFD